MICKHCGGRVEWRGPIERCHTLCIQCGARGSETPVAEQPGRETGDLCLRDGCQGRMKDTYGDYEPWTCSEEPEGVECDTCGAEPEEW